MNVAFPFPPQGSLPLEQQVARLQALLEASRQVHSTIRVNEVLERTAEILVRELEMEGAMFVAPGSSELLVAHGDLPPAPYEHCCRYPLYSKESQMLMELVIAPPSGGEISIYEQDFIEGLVLQASVALENATLHERDVQWARVQQDLAAARSVQRSLLPREMPEIPAFSIAGRSTTCYEVGGDYLDTIRLRDGSYLMVVADVAGKGLASAIVATSFRSALRSLATQSLPLDALANRIGQQHWDEGAEARRRYVTAIFLRLDPQSAEIEVVNAGHNPGALVRPDGSVRMIEASGAPLGLLPRMEYKAERLAFPAGTRLLLYTDGLTEVAWEEEEFGPERLVEVFKGHGSPQAGNILDSLWETLNSFSRNAPQMDDMTALAICHLNSAEQESSNL